MYFGCGFKYAVHLDGFGQPPQIFLARNFDRAQLLCDGRRQLNVEQDDAVAAQLLNQMVKRCFRRVADPVEHGFAREESANGHAVDAADELRSLPAFNAVRVTFFVQPRIGIDEVGAEPGALASGSRLRARLDDFAKGAVNSDFKDAVANHSRQTFRNMEPVQLKNRARVGRPPRDGVVGPGENPAAIRQQQTRHRQITADGDQAVKFTAALRRTRIRKP